MTYQRIVAVLLTIFFLVIGVATSTRHHSAVIEQELIITEVQRLSQRRDALKNRIDDLERRCKELEQQVSEREMEVGD